jgi:D-beta-D-heptose 7-phosphate kinase/D-beta-D-heptose 1-phosphate adenosyltransferase
MKFLVIGDACHDYYHYGSINRKNPEASAHLLNDISTECKEGMALNVAANLRAFGVDVDVAVPEQPWSEKHRYIDRRTGTQLLRVDYDREPIHEYAVPPYDLLAYSGIVVSDYNKGFVSRERLWWLSTHDHAFIDTKKKDLQYHDHAWFKLNMSEYKSLESLPKRLVVTDGENGCWHKGRNYNGSRVNVVDVCGAGDTFLAAFAYSTTKTRNLEQSLIFSNKCAAIACQHQGVYALQPEDVPLL